MLCRDALLPLCLQHVTIWRKNTAVHILKNITWHLKNFYAYYCQTRKEKILTKENNYAAFTILHFAFFFSKFVLIHLHTLTKEFWKNAGMQSNFIYNTFWQLWCPERSPVWNGLCQFESGINVHRANWLLACIAIVWNLCFQQFHIKVTIHEREQQNNRNNM